MESEFNKCIFALFSLLVLALDYISCGGIHLPEYFLTTNDEMAERCQWDGQKLANPKFGDKLLLCHFHTPANKWVAYPFTCIPNHRFVSDAQRCLRYQILANAKGHQLLTFETFPDEGLITEIPDSETSHENSVLSFQKRKQEKTKIEGRSDQRQKQGRDETCGASLRSLSSTIATMSKTIEKLSAKLNQPAPSPTSNNTTINVRIPEFLALAELLKGGPSTLQLSPKILEDGESSKVTNPTKPHLPEHRFQKNDTLLKNTSTNVEHSAFKPMPWMPMLQTTTVKTPFQKVTEPALEKVEANPKLDTEDASASHNSVHVRPGNGFMDFLLKSFLTPVPHRSPILSHQVPKLPYQLNISRPQNYGFKPLPFRPRPYPQHYSHHSQGHRGQGLPNIPPSTNTATSDPPKPPTFVNMLSLLQKINEASPFKSGESDEDEEISSDEWNGISHGFGANPKPVPAIPATNTGSSSIPPEASPVIASATVMSVPTSTSSPNSTQPGGSASSSTNIPTSTVVPSMLTRSSDFTEFDNNDDEAEEEVGENDEASLPLNNRKPRRV